MVERDFYPLTTLAERWACTVHDLMHLGIQDRAQVCANIYAMASGYGRTRIETEAPEAATNSAPLTGEERRRREAHDAASERWKNRTTKDMPDGVFELGHDDLRCLEMPNAFPYDLGEALKFDGGWWKCEFDPPVTINLDHLCMLHEEVVRLQREMFNVFRTLRPLATEPGGELDDGFYLNAVFPPAGMASPAVSLINAAMWLLGVGAPNEMDKRSIEERDAILSSVHKALEDVEIAVAMGELKATEVLTTRVRRMQEHLQDLVDPLASAAGLQVEFNRAAQVYLAPKELQNWWARRNAALGAGDLQRPSAAQIDPRSETTYLNIIGAMLELLRNPRPGRDSDAAVIRELIDNYSDKPGISKTTLEGKFAEARRRLNST